MWLSFAIFAHVKSDNEKCENNLTLCNSFKAGLRRYLTDKREGKALKIRKLQMLI